jgi:hypothetical protein
MHTGRHHQHRTRRRRTGPAAVLSIILGGLAVSALGASPAQAQQAADEFSLVSAMHGKCITVPPSQTAPRVTMSRCAGSSHGSNQRWTYDPVSGEFRTPWNQCLDASGAEVTAPVRAYFCTGGGNQKWDIDERGRIRLRAITAPNRDPLCLTVANGDRSDGAVLWVTYCHRGENQLFRRDPSGTGGSIVSIQTDLTYPDADTACVDVPIRELGAIPGVRAWLWDCQGVGHTNQRFTRTSEMEFRIAGTLCLDGGTGQDGSAVRIQPCNGGASQRWNLGAFGELKGVDGRCLHAPGESDANGNALVMYGCNGVSRGQRWSYRDLR